MKAFQILSIVALFVFAGLNLNAQEKKDTTVVFKAAIHCPSCKAKVDKNLPYEKGVKKYDFNLKDTTITVTYRMDKNSVNGLRAAIERHDVKVLGMCDANGKFIRHRHGHCTTPDCKDCEKGNCQDCENGHQGTCTDCKENHCKDGKHCQQGTCTDCKEGQCTGDCKEGNCTGDCKKGNCTGDCNHDNCTGDCDQHKAGHHCDGSCEKGSCDRHHHGEQNGHCGNHEHCTQDGAQQQGK